MKDLYKNQLSIGDKVVRIRFKRVTIGGGIRPNNVDFELLEVINFTEQKVIAKPANNHCEFMRVNPNEIVKIATN